MSAISRYQAAVQRSGIGFGWRYDFQNWEKDEREGLDADSFVADAAVPWPRSDLPFVPFADAKRRTVDWFIDFAEYAILGIDKQRVYWLYPWFAYLCWCGDDLNCIKFLGNKPDLAIILIVVFWNCIIVNRAAIEYFLSPLSEAGHNSQWFFVRFCVRVRYECWTKD